MKNTLWWLVLLLTLGMLLYLGLQAASPPERLETRVAAVATPTFTATATPWQYIGPTPNALKEYRP